MDTQYTYIYRHTIMEEKNSICAHTQKKKNLQASSNGWEIEIYSFLGIILLLLITYKVVSPETMHTQTKARFTDRF